MYLYRLRILLNIAIDCNMIPCLLQLDFVFFFPAYFFSLVLFQTFCFLRPVKGLRIRLPPPDKFLMFSLYLYLYLLLVALPYLHLIADTYLPILIYIYVLFILFLLIYIYFALALLYELDKIV